MFTFYIFYQIYIADKIIKVDNLAQHSGKNKLSGKIKSYLHVSRKQLRTTSCLFFVKNNFLKCLRKTCLRKMVPHIP